jgi:hypothetical protein
VGSWALLTTVVAVICAEAISEYARKKSALLVFHFMMGVMFGVLVGLVMIPLTGGISLVCAPAVLPVTMVALWAFQRKTPRDRDTKGE